MAWNVTTEEVMPNVADGEYDAILIGVEDDESKHGVVARMDFKITSECPWAGRTVIGIASKKLSANSKLGGWVASLLSRMPTVGENISKEDILNQACRIVVEQRSTEDNKVFSNVVDVLSRAQG